MLKILPQPSFTAANSIVLVPAQDRFLTQCLSAFSHRASAQEQARRGLTSAVGGEERRREGRSVKSTRGKSVTFRGRRARRDNQKVLIRGVTTGAPKCSVTVSAQLAKLGNERSLQTL